MQKAGRRKALDITKDGSRLVVIGNFRKANGLDRDQAVQIDLTGTSSSIDAWQTNGFKPLCYNFANDWTVRSGVPVSRRQLLRHRFRWRRRSRAGNPV